MSTKTHQIGGPKDVSELPGWDHLAHLVWESSILVQAYAEPLMDARTPLSQASIGSLQLIATYPGITASELARAAFKTQQAVSQCTGRLERLGYVERHLGAGRGVGLRITSDGERALELGLASEREVERRLEEMLGAGRYDQLRELLQDLRTSLVEAESAH